MFKKNPDGSWLVITTVLNKKLSKVENKIQAVCSLSKKQMIILKYQTLQQKKFSTSDYNKYTNTWCKDKILANRYKLIIKSLLNANLQY